MHICLFTPILPDRRTDFYLKRSPRSLRAGNRTRFVSRSEQDLQLIITRRSTVLLWDVRRDCFPYVSAKALGWLAGRRRRVRRHTARSWRGTGRGLAHLEL